MGDSISFSEFEKYARNPDDHVAWAIAQAKLKKVTPKLRKFDASFDALIRTNHFEDAFSVQLEALNFIKQDAKTDWNSYFEDLFSSYPPRGLFGYYGRIVSALYISEEILELVDHLDQFISTKQRELTVENIQQTNGEVQKIRGPITEAGQLHITALREVVPDLSKSGIDWRLRLLVRSRELKIANDLVTWVPPTERYAAKEVPIFSQYYATYADMGTEQRAFFNEVFKPKFLAGVTGVTGVFFEHGKCSVNQSFG